MKQRIKNYYLLIPAAFLIAAKSSHLYLNGIVGIIIGAVLAAADIFCIFRFRKTIKFPAAFLMFFIVFSFMVKSQSELTFAVATILEITFIFIKKI